MPFYSAAMTHDIPLISVLAIGFGLALIFGFVAEKLKLPALLGYLFAGFLIGPATPGFVADAEISTQLAEVGVMLLMFGVGIHFSLNDLWAVKKIALLGALIQMICATALGFCLAQSWAWTIGESLVFGVSLSVASTVVLLKALEAHNLLNTHHGKIAIGWLVVEDLFMVLILVLLPPLAGLLQNNAHAQSLSFGDLALGIFITLLKVALFIVFMLLAGKRLIPKALFHIAKTGSRELFTLSVIALAISLAFLAANIFGVSFALGAFVAGMVMRESEFSHRAAEESLPLRDAFAVLFFISVGMLFNPQVMIDTPLRVLAILAVIIIGKGLAAACLVIALRYSFQSALLIAFSLAQIGEFSFILIGLGSNLGILRPEIQNLVVCGAILSIAINPFLFSKASTFGAWLHAHSTWVRKKNTCSHMTESLENTVEEQNLRQHVIVLGYSPLGESIVKRLEALSKPLVITTPNREQVETLRSQGKIALAGSATEPSTLVQAHCAHATHLVIAEGEWPDIQIIIECAKLLNPMIQIHIPVSTQPEAAMMAHTEGIFCYTATECMQQSIVEHIVQPSAHAANAG